MKRDQLSRQESLYSARDKALQKHELAKAYQRERRNLEEKCAGLRHRIAEERHQLAEARKAAAISGQGATSPAVAKHEQRLAKLNDRLQRRQQRLQSLPERQRLGMECIESASVTRGPDGEITILSKVGPSQPRLGYEGYKRSGLLPVAGSERLHSQGAGTGFECSEGICAGPREVNHELQRHGIEQSVRDVYGQKRSDVELWQKTVVRQHPGSNQLSEIQYEISARTVGSRSAGERLYSTSIVVDRSGKSHVPADSERLNPNIEEYLRPLPNRNRGPQQQIGQHVRQTPQKGNLAKQLPSPSAAGNTRHSGLKQGRQEALVHSRGRSTNHVAQRSKSRSIRPGR